MKRRELMLLLLCIAVTSLTGRPGWAKFGMSKTWITFMMHHPPAFVTPGREVRTDATSLDAGNAVWARQFKIMLEQNLLGANFKPSPSAQTGIQFTVNDMSASVQEQRRRESVNVHTGYHNEYDKNGKATQVEDCASQEHEVTYLVSSGTLAASLQVTDAKSQAALLTRVLDPSYSRESDVAGPQKCGGRSYGVSPGQLQDPQAIRRWLLERAVHETMKMVVGYDESRRAMLTVDNELKPGNSYAVAGNWQQAFETWKNAAIKEKDRGKEGARQYNLGLAHEVLAAEAMRNDKLDEANSHLNEAEKCYSQALSFDPGEKYFREILTRLQHDRLVLKQEQEHQFMKEAAATAAAAPMNAAPLAPRASTIPLEGWPEAEAEATHDYRVYVRTRVAAQKQDPDDAFRQKLVASAADYGVKEGIALQVVDSEVGRFLILRQNVQKYLEDFKDAASDGLIAADEREMLKKRQKVLHLSDSQAREVEAQFQVRETK